MDEPEMNMSHGNCLNVVGINENLEEAEDIEEQIRRREELQNLLINALDDFKYEDSTINSSTNISVASVDLIEQTYGDSQTHYEQLKLLYNVRMKEILSLKEEFDNFKTNSVKEINNLKRNLTLQEAETSQMEISWRNTKSILEEKMDVISKQDRELTTKNEEIDRMKKTIEKLQYDVQAYNLMMEELQLKLAMDKGPFNVAARVFNSEELQNNHKEQIEKLEVLLDEHNRKIEILSKEKVQLQDDLKKKIENDSANEKLYNNTIALLNSNVESAQNQCKDLLNLVEMLSTENDHYRGRIQKLEAAEPILLSNSFKRKSLDYDTLLAHNERLKKMLLDKDVEVSTLKSKVKFYDTDMRELIEYRTIKNKSLLNKECSKSDHSETIAFMQYELKNLQNSLIDKEREIADLTLTNKELEDKIENMIIQTRNELEVISNKYKVPELEMMKKELQNTEMKIGELHRKLAESEDLRSKMKANDEIKLKQLNEEEKKISVLKEMLCIEKDKNEKYTQVLDENERLKKELENVMLTIKDKQHYEKIEEELALLKKEYTKISEQLKKLKQSEGDEHSIENMMVLRADIESFRQVYATKLIQKELMDIQITSWINQIDLNCKHIEKNLTLQNHLKKKCEKLSANLQQSQEKIEELTEDMRKMNNSKILLEDEKKRLETDISMLKEEMNTKNNELEDLKREIIKDEDKSTTIKTLEDASLYLEEAKQDLMKYQEEIHQKNEIIKNNDLKIAKLEAEVQNAKENLELSQKEMQKLQKVVDELLDDERTSKKEGDENFLGNEYYYKAKLLKAEVCIRENLQRDYQCKLSKIEDEYKKILEINQQKLNTFKEQENNYRHQLADVLSKYAQMISPIQKENEELKDHLNKMQVYYSELKTNLEITKKEYNISIEKIEKEGQESIDEWIMWAKTFVQGCLNIEKLNGQSRNRIFNSLQETDHQIESIHKYFEEKMKKYKKRIPVT